MMTCRAFHDLLQERLDGREITNSAALAEHLRTCADCRGLEAASRRLQQGLPRLVLPVPPDLTARIVTRAIADRRLRRKTRHRWEVTVALAACLLLALGLRLDWFGLRGLLRPTAPANQVSRQEDPGDKIEQPSPAPETLRDSVAEASRAVATLTSETVSQTRLMFPQVSAPSLTEVDLPQLEPATRPLREAGEGVTTALEPVTNSARRAVNLFLRELPPMDMTTEY